MAPSIHYQPPLYKTRSRPQITPASIAPNNTFFIPHANQSAFHPISPFEPQEQAPRPHNPITKLLEIEKSSQRRATF